MVVGLRSDSAWENDPLRRPGFACWSLCPSYTTTLEWHAALGALSGSFCVARVRTRQGTPRGPALPDRRPGPPPGEAGRGPDPLPLMEDQATFAVLMSARSRGFCTLLLRQAM